MQSTKQRFQVKWRMILAVMNAIWCNCIKKPEKNFRTSTGFEHVTSRYQCDALTNWAMKPLTLGAGQLWIHIFPWKRWVRMMCIWNKSYMNCGIEINWRMVLAVINAIWCNCIKKYDLFHIHIILKTTIIIVIFVKLKFTLSSQNHYQKFSRRTACLGSCPWGK